MSRPCSTPQSRLAGTDRSGDCLADEFCINDDIRVGYWPTPESVMASFFALFLVVFHLSKSAGTIYPRTPLNFARNEK